MKPYLAPALLAPVVGIQFVGPRPTNPPERPGATFEALTSRNPEAAAVVRRACQDCHSHRTVWPWYSRLAPFSWLMARDVEKARAREGVMPIWQYTLSHGGARLRRADVAALCAALRQPKL